ncbi:MAG TPA: PDZ domain-containing protein [Bacilli bacterium]
MERWQRWYLVGMGWIGVLCILGELIWLPDPIRLGAQVYWIDLINMMAYLLVIPPLLWIASAVWGLVKDGEKASPGGNPNGGLPGRLGMILLRGGIIAAAGLTIIFIVEEQLLALAVSLGAAWLLTIADISVCELRRIRRISNLRPVYRLPWRGVIVLTLSVFLLAALFWPMPYMVTYPGLTMNMNRYAAAEGGTSQGQIMGVLVFERPAFPVDWLYAQLFSHYSFERREKLDMSLREYDHLVREMKLDANTVGSAVGFQEAGIGKGVINVGVRVLGLIEDSPAEGQLLPGDIIVALNGEVIGSAQDLADPLGSVRPGGQVSLTVLRAGKQLAVSLGTMKNPDHPERAAFGIQIADEVKPDLPRSVAFRHYLAHEGGPSHGAALALALVDQLTPGGVTNGHVVAVTGTIDAAGVVGKIGGIGQKAFSVKRTEADVFFVPAGQEAKARQSAPDLQIVPVKTLKEILAWLKAHPVN